MNLWQMLMARRGLMDVAESHERGGAGAGAPAGAEEQGTQESGKQNGEQKKYFCKKKCNSCLLSRQT